MFSDTVNIVRTPQSILERFHNNDSWFVRKTATASGGGDVRAQIEMLQRLPSSLAKHYPELIAWNLDDTPASYTMPLYTQPSLRRLVFDSAETEALQRTLTSVVEFLFKLQYKWIVAPSPGDYIRRVHMDRMLTRLARMREEDPTLNAILSAGEIHIGDEISESPLRILQEIAARKSVVAALSPVETCSIHGQMEFDHVIVNLSQSAEVPFILLDPRGIQSLGDPAYDLGKMWQSCRTMVDLLEEEQFAVTYDVAGDHVVFEQFDLWREDRHQVCSDLAETLVQLIEAWSVDSNSPHLQMQSDFAEAVHLCSAVPFYYEGPRKVDRAVACYALGAKAFQRWKDRYL